MMRRNNARGRTFVVLAFLAVGGLQLAAQTAHTPDSRSVVTALKDYQGLVGEWRGVGQPRRGSNVGSWQETALGAWQHAGKQPGIRWDVSDGKLWTSFLLTTGDETRPYEVLLQVDADTARRYRGTQQNGRLQLESEPDAAAEVYRLTITWLGADRCLVLSEKRQERQSFYQRVAEVAYQRQGTKLAAKDGSGPECVVTGGLGTIAVMHQGKTYYVCCTGCRDAFLADPEGILADLAARKAK